MTKHNVRGVLPEDLPYLAEHLRAADLIEHVSAHGHTNVLKTLELSVQNSDEARVGTWEGRPAVIWGITSRSPTTALIWCVGTPEIFKGKTEFIRGSHAVIREWFSRSPELQNLINFVHAKNTRHIRWLKAMGATIYPPVSVGASSDGFCPFVIRRYPDV